MMQPDARVAEGCSVGLMIDGRLQSLPDAQTLTIGQEHGYGAALPLGMLRSIASATRVAGRVCGAEWRLTEEGRALFAEFVARIDEEGAWSASAQSEPDPETAGDEPFVAP